MPRKGLFFMDHYTAEAYEKVRVRIVEHIDRLELTGKTGSGDIHNVKNWRRFGAGFAWDPEVYMDILQNPDMPDKELMSKLRKTEGDLMKKWAVVDKMPMHHKIALRTGGDLGLRTPVNIWTETRARLYERFGFEPGNGPSNLNATSQFDERIHRWRDNAKGSPNSMALSTPGLMEGLEKDNVVLHRKGQDLGNMPEQYMPLIGATSQQQADFLEEYIVNQVKRYDQAKGHFRTKQAEKALNDGLSWFFEDADAFSEARTLKDQAKIRSILQGVDYNDPITGEIYSLDHLYGKGFVGTGDYSINPQLLSLSETPRKRNAALNALKTSGGGLHWRNLKELPAFAGIEFRADIIPGGAEMGKAFKNNPFEALTGAAMNLADPDVIKSFFQGKPKEALEKGAMGAGIGAGIAEMLKVSPVQQARLTSYASKIPGVASQLPKALSFIGGAARFVGPVSTAVAGYQLADAVLESSTGAGFIDTFKQVKDKERTAKINKAAVESAAISEQLADEKELPKPIIDSDTIEKFATDPLNELEYGWKKLTGQV